MGLTFESISAWFVFLCLNFNWARSKKKSFNRIQSVVNFIRGNSDGTYKQTLKIPDRANGQLNRHGAQSWNKDKMLLGQHSKMVQQLNPEPDYCSQVDQEILLGHSTREVASSLSIFGFSRFPWYIKGLFKSKCYSVGWSVPYEFYKRY